MPPSPQSYGDQPTAAVSDGSQSYRRYSDMTVPSQTGSPLHDPQHHPPSAHPRASAAPADANALLHATDADPESMYHGREGKRCFSGFQDG